MITGVLDAGIFKAFSHSSIRIIVDLLRPAIHNWMGKRSRHLVVDIEHLKGIIGVGTRPSRFYYSRRPLA